MVSDKYISKHSSHNGEVSIYIMYTISWPLEAVYHCFPDAFNSLQFSIHGVQLAFPHPDLEMSQIN